MVPSPADRLILRHIFQLEPEMREPFEIFMRSISVPMKVVKAASVEEMKQCLTGRDAKNIISNAVRNFGAMLEYAYADPAAIAARSLGRCRRWSGRRTRAT